MKKKRNTWKWIALVLVIVAIGVAGILIGQNVTASKYQAEQELNYRLNRSDLDGLGEIEGTIYVTGHKVPDADLVADHGEAALLIKLPHIGVSREDQL